MLYCKLLLHLRMGAASTGAGACPMLLLLLLLQVAASGVRAQDGRSAPYGGIPEVPESIRKNPMDSKGEKPKIIMYWPLENLTIPEGRKAAFLCDITGFPIPEYTWAKGDRNLTKADRHYLQEVTTYGSVLTIAKVQTTDADSYTCLGANEAGYQITTAQLKVLPEAGANPPGGGGGGSGGGAGGGTSASSAADTR